MKNKSKNNEGKYQLTLYTWDGCDQLTYKRTYNTLEKAKRALKRKVAEGKYTTASIDNAIDGRIYVIEEICLAHPVKVINGKPIITSEKKTKFELIIHPKIL